MTDNNFSIISLTVCRKNEKCETMLENRLQQPRPAAAEIDGIKFKSWAKAAAFCLNASSDVHVHHQSR